MNDTLYQVLFFMFFIISLTTIITFIILVIRIIISCSRGRSLPQKHLFYSIILLMLSLILGYNQYFNLEYLPSGVLNATITSPNEKYVIKTYHFDGIYGDNAKAVLINLSNGDEKTIYFNHSDYDPKVEWLSDDKVKIGVEKLNIHKDTYDYRWDFESSRTLPPQRS